VPQAVYDRIGVGYAQGRRPDPRWQAEVDAALGTSRTVLNVGAGTSSYEPVDRDVVAVEPSRTMIAQRPVGAAKVLRATAENLPLADGRFDVAMAPVTLHHWRDWAAGLREMQRVPNRAVVLHFDPESFHSGLAAIRRIDSPAARPCAISFRSANDRHLPCRCRPRRGRTPPSATSQRAPFFR